MSIFAEYRHGLMTESEFKAAARRECGEEDYYYDGCRCCNYNKDGYCVLFEIDDPRSEYCTDNMIKAEEAKIMEEVRKREWITDEEPIVEDVYYVTWKCDETDRPFVGFIYWDGGWVLEEPMTYHNNVRITAWMASPEPYEGE